MKCIARTLLVIVAVAFAAAASAQVDLTWHTIDGGGGECAGGDFTLGGTIGQPDAGTMTGGNYTLTGGFWISEEPVNTCPADIVNTGGSPGVVNVDDLLAVINQWGNCASPCPPKCTADIAGTPCVVNVDDLLAVINSWGPCP